jgi:hypothetical protein
MSQGTPHALARLELAGSTAFDRRTDRALVRRRQVARSILEKVSDDMNVSLCKEYTDEEIEIALFQMGPTKVPGPDGFSALFYQTHWEFLKDEICCAVRSFLDGKDIPVGFCDSVIVLIPKITNLQHLKNFRPISLCN